MRIQDAWPCGLVVALLATATPPLGAQQPQPGTGPQSGAVAEVPDAARKLDALLKQWERQSTGRTRFDVRFTRTDIDTVYQRRVQSEGRMLHRAPDLLRLDLTTKDEATNTSIRTRIIATKNEIYRYHDATRQIEIHPLGADDRARAHREGYLPFLFQVRAQALRERYIVRLLKESETSYWLQITPKNPADIDGFAEAYLILDRRRLLPDYLRLIDANGKSTQTYKFLSIDPDAKVDEELFKPKLTAQWKVVRFPNPDEAARSEVLDILEPAPPAQPPARPR